MLSAPVQLRVGVRGVAAEVPEPGRAEHRVGDGVGHGVGVAVAVEAPGPVAGDDHPAQHQRPVGSSREPVDVDPLADPEPVDRSVRDRRAPRSRSPGHLRHQRLGQAQVLGPGQLQVARLAGHRAHGSAQLPPPDRRRRWPRPPSRWAARRVAADERLGRLHGHQPVPVDGGHAPGRPATRFRVSATGRTGMAPVGAPGRTASTTAANSDGGASGRAASWTTMMAASSGTAASPARTESARVAPPVTTRSAPGADPEPARAPGRAPPGCPVEPVRSGTTSTTPSATERAASPTRPPPAGRPAGGTAWAHRTGDPIRLPPRWPRRTPFGSGKRLVEPNLGGLLVDAQGEGQLRHQDLAGPAAACASRRPTAPCPCRGWRGSGPLRPPGRCPRTAASPSGSCTGATSWSASGPPSCGARRRPLRPLRR